MKTQSPFKKNRSTNVLWLALVVAVSCFIFMRSDGAKSGVYKPGVTVDTAAPKPAKKYVVSYTQEEWQLRLNWLAYISQQLKRTDLPAREVGFMTDSLITRFQMELIGQIQTQLPKDTVTHR